MEAISLSLLILTVYGFALIGYCALKRKQESTVRIAYVNIIIMYALLLAAISLPEINLPQKYGFNYIPFVKFFQAESPEVLTRYILYSAFAVALFIPLGVLMGMYCKLKALRHEVLYSVMLGLLISLIIEVTQIYLPFNRICDVDEIFFNVLGTFVGSALFYRLSEKRFMKNMLRRILYF